MAKADTAAPRTITPPPVSAPAARREPEPKHPFAGTVETVPQPPPVTHIVPKLAGPGGQKVRATKPGYYDDKRRRTGDVFVVAAGDPLSDKWMEPVDPRTPEKLTTGAEELKRKHDEALAGRTATPTGGSSVIDDE
jgi:hypothetical protein